MNTQKQAVVVAPLAALAPMAALASETLLGLAPCALCLWQRWPYWVAAAFALMAAKTHSRIALAFAGLAILGSGAIAGVHVGVEQRWWPSPLPSCAAPDAGSVVSVDEMMSRLAAKPAKPCDAPTYLIPRAPISMAGMNLAYAIGLGGLTIAWALRNAARKM